MIYTIYFNANSENEFKGNCEGFIDKTSNDFKSLTGTAYIGSFSEQCDKMMDHIEKEISCVGVFFERDGQEYYIEKGDA